MAWEQLKRDEAEQLLRAAKRRVAELTALLR